MNTTAFLFVFFLVYLLNTCAKNGTLERFVTLQPPELQKKTQHWEHNFAEKSNLRDDVIYSDKLVNAFPMQKPPSQWEKTQTGAFDVARAQFIPKMGKRV